LQRRSIKHLFSVDRKIPIFHLRVTHGIDQQTPSLQSSRNGRTRTRVTMLRKQRPNLLFKEIQNLIRTGFMECEENKV
jgi:hypothetical protein